MGALVAGSEVAVHLNMRLRAACGILRGLDLRLRDSSDSSGSNDPNDRSKSSELSDPSDPKDLSEFRFPSVSGISGPPAICKDFMTPAPPRWLQRVNTEKRNPLFSIVTTVAVS